jgi:hypothetical protein
MATQFKDVDGVRATNGVATAVNTADLTSPPTQGELATTFGTAASQVGKIYIHDDAGANTTARLVVSNGTSYYFVNLTKA